MCILPCWGMDNFVSPSTCFRVALDQKGVLYLVFKLCYVRLEYCLLCCNISHYWGKPLSPWMLSLKPQSFPAWTVGKLLLAWLIFTNLFRCFVVRPQRDSSQACAVQYSLPSTEKSLTMLEFISQNIPAPSEALLSETFWCWCSRPYCPCYLVSNSMKTSASCWCIWTVACLARKVSVILGAPRWAKLRFHAPSYLLGVGPTSKQPRQGLTWGTWASRAWTRLSGFCVQPLWGTIKGILTRGMACSEAVSRDGRSWHT